MSFRAGFWLFVVLLGLGLAGMGGLFWVQNSATTVPVSFELWGLGRLGRVWTASELMGVSALTGFGSGALLMFVLWWRAQGRARARAQVHAAPADDARAWK